MSGGAAVLGGASARSPRWACPCACSPCRRNREHARRRAMKPGDIVRAMTGRRSRSTTRTPRAGSCWPMPRVRGRPGRRAAGDVATLTGGIVVALAPPTRACSRPTRRWRAPSPAAAIRAAELSWRLPLHAEYDEMIKGRYADIVNSKAARRARSRGPVPQALRRAACRGRTWTSPAPATTTEGLHAQGRRGCGVRPLVELAARRAHRGLQPFGVAATNPLVLRPRGLPARARAVGCRWCRSAGRRRHEDVAVVRVDRDPAAGPRGAPWRSRPEVERRVEQPGGGERVAHRPRAVVAAVDERAVAAAPDVRELAIALPRAMMRAMTSGASWGATPRAVGQHAADGAHGQVGARSARCLSRLESAADIGVGRWSAEPSGGSGGGRTGGRDGSARPRGRRPRARRPAGATRKGGLVSP